MQQIIAFNGNEKTKEKYLKRVQKHYEMDEIVQGIYWENGKGCAVGCTLEYGQSGDIHKRFEKELGVPEQLARLEDHIFENLTNGDAKKFPLRFLKAIKPGADLSKVQWQFQLWLLVDKHNGVIKYANAETKKIIKQIAALHRKEIKGEEPDLSAWSAAESAARSAAWSAARSAAWSAAWSAARSAAESAARSAAWSAAESAAESAAYKRMANKLISLLEKAE